MTIEKSPAPASGHKPAAHGASHGAKTRATAADAAAGSAGGAGAAGHAAGNEGAMGFLSILGALGSLGEAPAEPGADAAAANPLASDALPADATAGAPATVPFDVNAWLQQNPQIVTAQPPPAAADAASAQAPDPALLAQAALAGAGASALQAAAPLVTSALDAPAVPTTTRPGGATQAAASQTAAQAAAAKAATDGAGDAAALQPGAGESPTQGLQQAHAQRRAGQDALQATADADNASAAKAVPANDRAETHKFLAALEQAKSAPEGARALEPVLAPLLARSEKTLAERNAAGIKATEPGYLGAALGVNNNPDYALSTSQTGGVAPEMQVAEQVSYWVSHNVQNAELKLDGLGLSPVEVSIRMQGNEAQIAFRTDEAATRELLERAGAHLKELLQSEGLQLGGVSVGSSGDSGVGQGNSGERQKQHNVRQLAIAPLQTAAVEAAPRRRTMPASGAGRAVDLFV